MRFFWNHPFFHGFHICFTAWIAERPGVAPAGHAVPRSSAVDSAGHLLSALAQGRVTWEIDGRAFWGILGLENGK